MDSSSPSRDAPGQWPHAEVAPASILAVLGENERSHDAIAHEVESSLEGAVEIREGTARLLHDGGDESFHVFLDADGRICLVGQAPRSVIGHAEAVDAPRQHAVTCEHPTFVQEHGLLLLIGPTDDMRGALIVPDQFAGVATLHSPEGTSRVPVRRNVVVFSPFEDVTATTTELAEGDAAGDAFDPDEVAPAVPLRITVERGEHQRSTALTLPPAVELRTAEVPAGSSR